MRVCHNTFRMCEVSFGALEETIQRFPLRLFIFVRLVRDKATVSEWCL